MKENEKVGHQQRLGHHQNKWQSTSSSIFVSSGHESFYVQKLLCVLLLSTTGRRERIAERVCGSCGLALCSACCLVVHNLQLSQALFLEAKNLESIVVESSSIDKNQGRMKVLSPWASSLSLDKETHILTIIAPRFINSPVSSSSSSSRRNTSLENRRATHTAPCFALVFDNSSPPTFTTSSHVFSVICKSLPSKQGSRQQRVASVFLARIARALRLSCVSQRNVSLSLVRVARTRASSLSTRSRSLRLGRASHGKRRSHVRVQRPRDELSLITDRSRRGLGSLGRRRVVSYTLPKQRRRRAVACQRSSSSEEEVQEQS